MEDSKIVEWFKDLLCKIFGHKYYILKEFGTSRKLGCKRCKKKFGMHDPTKTLIEWNSDLEFFYEEVCEW